MRFVVLNMLYFLLLFVRRQILYLGGGNTGRREILHDGTAASRMLLLPFRGGVSKCEVKKGFLRTIFGLSDNDYPT